MSTKFIKASKQPTYLDINILLPLAISMPSGPKIHLQLRIMEKSNYGYTVNFSAIEFHLGLKISLTFTNELKIALTFTKEHTLKLFENNQTSPIKS